MSPPTVNARVASQEQDLGAFIPSAWDPSADLSTPGRQKTEFLWHHVNANHTTLVEVELPVLQFCL